LRRAEWRFVSKTFGVIPEGEPVRHADEGWSGYYVVLYRDLVGIDGDAKHGDVPLP